MKKRTLFIIIAAVLLLTAILIAIFSFYARVGEFSLNDYQRFLEDFSSEKILGEEVILGNVPDAKDAKKKAEEIWIRVYGDNFKDEKPYRVAHDSENGVWLVQGSPTVIFAGGAAKILIEKDTGRVLAVWHEK